MMELSLDRQTASRDCPDCNASFMVVQGSVYDDGRPFGLYLIALHGHSPRGPLAHVAIAVLDMAEVTSPPFAVAIEVVATPTQYESAFVDWSASPWRDEHYLGRLLNRSAALRHERRPLFFHILDHLMDDLPEVQAHFSPPTQ